MEGKDHRVARWRAKGSFNEYLGYFGTPTWVKRGAVSMLHIAAWADLLEGNLDLLPLCLTFILLGSLPLDARLQILKRIERIKREQDAVPVAIQFLWKNIRYGADEGWVWFRNGELIFHGTQTEFVLGAEDVQNKDHLVEADVAQLGWDDGKRVLRIIPFGRPSTEIGVPGPSLVERIRDHFWGSSAHELPPLAMMPGMGYRGIEGAIALVNRLSLLVIFAALIVKFAQNPSLAALLGVPALVLSFTVVVAATKLYSFSRDLAKLRRSS